MLNKGDADTVSQFVLQVTSFGIQLRVPPADPLAARIAVPNMSIVVSGIPVPFNESRADAEIVGVEPTDIFSVVKLVPNAFPTSSVITYVPGVS